MNSPSASLSIVTGLSALLLVSLLLVSPTAAQEALRAPTWNHPSASAGLRLGTADLNLGFGLRGGFTLAPGIYIGALGDYFFGNSTTTGATEHSMSAWLLMVEVGYDVGLVDGALLVRPTVNLGAVGNEHESCTGSVCSDRGYTRMRGGIGGQVSYFFSPHLAAGSELRLLFTGSTVAILGANLSGVL